MTKTLALALVLVLTLAPLVPAGAQWKPEIRFLKIGVSSAGGDWFRAGAKFSTMIPAALPEVGVQHRHRRRRRERHPDRQGRSPDRVRAHAVPRAGLQGREQALPDAAQERAADREQSRPQRGRRDGRAQGQPDQEHPRHQGQANRDGRSRLGHDRAGRGVHGRGRDAARQVQGRRRHHQLHVHHRPVEGPARQERRRDLHPGPGQLPRPDGRAAGGRDPGRSAFPTTSSTRRSPSCPGSPRARSPRASTAWSSRTCPPPASCSSSSSTPASRTSWSTGSRSSGGRDQGHPRDRARPRPGRREDGHGARHHPVPPGAVRYYKEVGVAR